MDSCARWISRHEIRTWSGWHRAAPGSVRPRLRARDCSVCTLKVTLRGTKGSGWVSQRRTPSTLLGQRIARWGARTIRRLEPTKRSETSVLLEIQGVFWDLVPNAPRLPRRKRHLTLAPALSPVHEDPTDDKQSSSSDSPSSSSTSTQAQNDSRSQPRTVMGTNVLVLLASTVLPTPTPKALIRSSAPTSEQPNPRHWTCLHRQRIREVKARRWTFGV